MPKALSGWLAPAVVFAMIFICSAARPFEALPADHPAHAQLATIAAAGLLHGFDLPSGSLSRLEAAVLTQKALAAYGEAQLAGGEADPAVEQALAGLCEGLAEELAALGGPPPRPAVADEALIQRVGDLEAALSEDQAAAEEEEAAPEEEAAAEEEPAPEEPAVEATLYGDLYFQGRASSTKLEPATEHATGTDRANELDLYWGELGVDATNGDWSAHASVALNDEDDGVYLHEAYGRYDNPHNGWYFQLGQAILPFGNNDFYFPTYPAVNDLGYTRAKVAGGGYEADKWGFSAHVFSPKVAIEGEEDTVKDFSAVVTLAQQETDECRDGYKLLAGYTSYLGCDDIRITGTDTCHARTAAYNVFGRYDWRGNQYHLLADYTSAAKDFAVADLDANGDGRGDQPRALNVEFVYEPVPDNLWGVSYEMTEEFAGYAANRLGLLFGKRLSEMTMFKLEYTHGEYAKDFAVASSDDRLVAEFNLAF